MPHLTSALIDLAPDRAFSQVADYRKFVRRINIPYSKHHFWVRCYSFFKNNFNSLFKKSSSSSLVGLAALNFGIYLASFSVYRGSDPLLNRNFFIYKGLVKKYLISYVSRILISCQIN